MANNLLAKSYNLKNNLSLLSLFKPLWGQRGVFTSIPIVGKNPNCIGLQTYLHTFNKSCKEYKFGITITPNLIQKLVGNESGRGRNRAGARIFRMHRRWSLDTKWVPANVLHANRE